MGSCGSCVLEADEILSWYSVVLQRELHRTLVPQDTFIRERRRFYVHITLCNAVWYSPILEIHDVRELT